MAQDIHEQIRDILNQHVGHANLISSNAIAEDIGVERGPSSVRIRTLIRETIMQFQMPVAGGSRGYFIIQNGAEMQAYIHNIRSRIDEMTDRPDQITGFYFGWHAVADQGEAQTNENDENNENEEDED